MPCATILRQKDDLDLCTLNPRTLKFNKQRTQPLLPVLNAFCLYHNIDILVLPESRTKEDEDFQPIGCTYQFISIRGDGAGNFGVAAMLSPRLQKEFLSSNTIIQHRVMELEFKTFRVHAVYGPATGDKKKDAPKAEKFYDEYGKYLIHQEADPEAAASEVQRKTRAATGPKVSPLPSTPTRADRQPAVPQSCALPAAIEAALPIPEDADEFPAGPQMEPTVHPDAVEIPTGTTTTPLPTPRLTSRQVSNAAKKLTVHLGDFNADLFKEDEVSDIFRGFLERIGALTTAQSLNNRSTTFKSSTKHGNTATLDYIVVPRRWIACCERMKVIDAPISTDHRAVMTTFRYRWKEEAKQKKKRKIEPKKESRDYSAMACSQAEREKYGLAFQEALKPLGDYETDGVSAFEVMERLKKANDAAAAMVLPMKGSGPKFAPVAPLLVPAMKQLEEQEEKRKKALQEDARQIQKEQGAQLKELERIRLDADTRLRVEAGRLIDEHLALLAKDPYHAWQRVFALEKKLAEKRAETITMKRLETHFGNLFQKSPTTVPVMLPEQRPWEKKGAPRPVFNTGPTDVKELQKCAWSQANHKATGKDEIPAEILKCPEVLYLVVQMFNKALCRDNPTAPLTDDDLPPQFFDAILVALYKKGDVEDTNNYRGISLMSYVAKLFHLFLMHRIREALDPWISPTQNAYRPSRGCQQHCVAAGLLHQHAQRHPDYELHMVFVDFVKAFDSLDRGAMRKILEWWTIPPGFVTIIMTMLDKHQLFVRHEGKLSENPITPWAGVLQGDTLAPYIFILCIDMILQQLPEEWGARLQNELDNDDETNRPVTHSSRSPVKRLSHLGYSDDVVLISNSTVNAQRLFTRFEQVATSLGMSINLGAGKTEEIRLNAAASDPRVKTAQGKEIGIVDNYKYLGTSLGKTWKEDFSRRKGLAWAIIRKYRHIWSSKAPVDGKQKLFQALVEPCLSYGAFTYPDLAAVTSTLHSTHSRMLRHCLGLPRANTTNAGHRPTEWLYYGTDSKLGKTNKSATLTLPGSVMRQRLSALGHWVRDHFYREKLGEGPCRRHPVIDVLRFDPSERLPGCRSGPTKTLRDSYLSAIRPAGGAVPQSDLLKSDILVSRESRCFDKNNYYNQSKHRVKEVDTELLHAAMKRRLDDPTRDKFGTAEYDQAKSYLMDSKNFTRRWLTRRTRENRLGEDIELSDGAS